MGKKHRVCLRLLTNRKLKLLPEDKAASRIDSSAKSTDSLALEPGLEIDKKYQLIEEIGRGANSVVFKAKPLLLDEYLAIKFFDPSISNSETALSRFHKEAQLLSTFDHPNIVKLKSFSSREGERQYMALEFLNGKTLAGTIAENGALTESKAMPLFIDICEGLAYAHERKIIHRDIKPANVLILEEEHCNTAKILDFGTIKQLDQAEQKTTKTGFIVGSSNYMSPEQCKGEEVDPRSDIYSLGCVMYETLCGAPPMAAETDLLIMSNHLNKTINSVPSKYPISEEMNSIICKCLSKAPEGRFQSAQQLKAELSATKDKPLIKTRKNSLLYMAVIMGVTLVTLAICMQSLKLWVRKDFGSYQRAEISDISEYKRVTPPELTIDSLKYYGLLLNWLEKHDWRGTEKPKGSIRHANADEKYFSKVCIEDACLRAKLGINAPSDFFQDLDLYLTHHLRNHELADPDLFNRSDADIRGELPVVLFVEKGVKQKQGLAEIEDRMSYCLKHQDDFASKAHLTDTVCKLAHLLILRAKYEDALNLLDRTEKMCGSNFDNAKDRLARVFHEKGEVYYWMGEEQLAIKNFLAALQIYKACDNGSVPDGLNGTLQRLNDLKQAKAVSDVLSDNSYFKGASTLMADGKLRDVLINSQYFELKRQLARSYLLQGQTDKAMEMAQEYTARYLRSGLDNNNGEDLSYQFEDIYMSSLYAKKTAPISIARHASGYLSNVQTKSAYHYLEDTARIIDALRVLKIAAASPLGLLDETIQKAEKGKKMPFKCMQVRYEIALAAIDKNDYEFARRQLDRAAAQTRYAIESDLRRQRAGSLPDLDNEELDKSDEQLHNRLMQLNIKTRWFLLALYARQMQVAAELKDRTGFEQAHQASLVLYSDKDDDVPMKFFNKHMYQKGRMQFCETPEEGNRVCKRFLKILRNHRDQAYLLDDYANCAIDCADCLLKFEQGSRSARENLVDCLAALRKQRASKHSEIAAIIRKIVSISNSEKEKAEYQPLLAAEEKSIEASDYDYSMSEPYQMWQR